MRNQFFEQSRIKNINSMTKSNVLSEVSKKFPNIVSNNPEQSRNNLTAEIILKPVAKPIFRKAYDVPYKLRDQVTDELNRLCKMDILVPVKFSTHASPIVIVNRELKLEFVLVVK